jgi:hypothetical protein
MTFWINEHHPFVAAVLELGLGCAQYESFVGRDLEVGDREVEVCFRESGQPGAWYPSMCWKRRRIWPRWSELGHTPGELGRLLLASVSIIR